MQTRADSTHSSTTRSSPPAGLAAAPTAQGSGPSMRAPCFSPTAGTTSSSTRSRSAASLSCGERSLGSDRTGPASRQYRVYGAQVAPRHADQRRARTRSPGFGDKRASESAGWRDRILSARRHRSGPVLCHDLDRHRTPSGPRGPKALAHPSLCPITAVMGRPNGRPARSAGLPSSTPHGGPHPQDMELPLRLSRAQDSN